MPRAACANMLVQYCLHPAPKLDMQICFAHPRPPPPPNKGVQQGSHVRLCVCFDADTLEYTALGVFLNPQCKPAWHVSLCTYSM